MRHLSRGLLVVGILAAVGLSLAACTSMRFIKRRLPPPTPTAEGIVFRFDAPSAKVAHLTTRSS